MFDMDQVDAAIQHVIDNGIENNGSLTNYTLLFSAAGLPPAQESPMVGEFMAAFHHRCRDRDLPPLDALIVHASGSRRGFPGPCYFRANNQPDPISPETPLPDKRDATTFWLNQIETCKLWVRRHRDRP